MWCGGYMEANLMKQKGTADIVNFFFFFIGDTITAQTVWCGNSTAKQNKHLKGF